MKNHIGLLIYTFPLISAFGFGSALAQDKVQWPKKCAHAPYTRMVSDEIRNFCLNFGADYFYRLKYTAEKMEFKSGENTQTCDRPKFSTEGALFLVAQAQVEAGWWGKAAVERHNFWGLMSGPDRLGSFPSFESGVAYYFTHMDHGIKGNGEDSPHHPGWPEFLKLMSQEGVGSDAINKSLNSGPYCRKGPAYNMGFEPNCAKTKKHGCPCVDYAGFIQKHSMAHVISYCLKVYDDFDRLPPGQRRYFSEVYPKSASATQPGLPDAQTRMDIVHAEFLKYAKHACGIEEAPAVSSQSKSPTAYECADETRQILGRIGSFGIKPVTCGPK